MEQSSPDTTPSNDHSEAASSVDNTEASAPTTRRRASRRVSAPAGEVAAAESTAVDAPADATATDDTAPAKTTARKTTARATTAKTAAARSAKSAAAADAAASAGEAESQTAAPKTAVAKRTAAKATADAAADAEAKPARRTRAKAAANSAETATSAQSDESAADAAATSATTTDTGATDAAAVEAPKRRTSRARKKTEETTEAVETGAAVATAEAVEPQSQTAAATVAAGDGAAGESGADEAAAAPATRRRTTRGRGRGAATNDQVDAAAENAEATADSGAENAATSGDTATETTDTGSGAPRNQNGRGSRNGRTAARNAQKASANGGDTAAEGSTAEPSDSSTDTETAQASRTDSSNGQQRGGDQPRSSRTRQRERKRRQSDDLEPELHEDDVLLPVAGILDVLDNYAFVRTSGYLPGTNDVYVSLGQVKKYGLRKGDAVVGAIRQPREGEASGRQKYNAIVKIDSVNSSPADEQQTRPEFADLTPLAPQQPMWLESGANARLRAIDLFAPIGKGQRGLISGPARSGKSALIEQIAEVIGVNQPESHLMVVLIDERPEEVTRMQRSVKGEVIASTLDRPVEDHITIAELAIERAKRLTELGHDVVVLLDSVTSLIRSYNLLGPATTRQPAGQIDAATFVPLKRLLSAARNIENGGSLTVLATVQTGTAADELVLDELLGAANLEIRLSAELAQQRRYPAIDFASSQTRRSAEIAGEAATQAIDAMRQVLAPRGVFETHEAVSKLLGETSTNVEFLTQAQRAYGRA